MAFDEKDLTFGNLKKKEKRQEEKNKKIVDKERKEGLKRK